MHDVFRVANVTFYSDEIFTQEIDNLFMADWTTNRISDIFSKFFTQHYL